MAGSLLEDELVAPRDAQAVLYAVVLDQHLAAVAEDLPGVHDDGRLGGWRGLRRLLRLGHGSASVGSSGGNTDGMILRRSLNSKR
jgi:hypothetical protein